MLPLRPASMTTVHVRRKAGALVLAAAIVAVVLAGCGGSAAHRRRPVLESLFQDDDHLVYAPTTTVASTLDTLASLGVDRLRITVLWAAIAPGSSSPVHPPHFSGADPAAYPPAAWVPYDRIVRMAAARHIGVDFNVTAPGPLWAMTRVGGHSLPRARFATHYQPSAAAFRAFVTAVGRRYSGSYVPAGGSGPVPRVDYWSIWNEPNQPGWLAPQWRTVAATPTMTSPRLYRSYVDAAFKALQRTGHGPSTDTILIGELAPEGAEANSDEAPIPPLPFLRAMYCVDATYRPLQGESAALLHCPASPSAFAAEHPALFDVTGFAHHPYSFFLPPTTSMADPNFAPLADLSRLEHALDAIFATYGVHRRLPLYLTEYGYETNPPNPFRGVSLRNQALYLNEAQYLAWGDPRVRAMSQFLLYDSPPDTRYPKGSVGYWSTFQTGLLYAGGVAKPSLTAYRLPLVIPQPMFAQGQPVYVWGMLRPASRGDVQKAQLQWHSSGGSYHTIATVDVRDASGFFATNVAFPGTGVVRIAWASPDGATRYSREVAVRAR